MWKVIPGLERYEISTDGEIRNIKSKLILKQQYYKCLRGHADMRIRLTTGGHDNARTYKVHRLLAKTYLTDYSEDLTVDHINGDSTDNRLENIRMCSQQENCNNPITIKRYKANKEIGKRNLGNWLGNPSKEFIKTAQEKNQIKVVCIDTFNNVEATYDSIEILADELKTKGSSLQYPINHNTLYKKRYLIKKI